MELKIKHIVLTAAFCFFSIWTYAQMENQPPAPRMAQSSGPQLCSPYDHDNDPDTPDITPPPGLCMPIDEYVIPLLVAGLIFGAYRMYKVDKARVS